MSKKFTKSMTAAELLQKLSNDPEYVALVGKRDADISSKVASSKREQTALLAELRSVGVSVDSVWDLIATQRGYVQALPVLFRHFSSHEYSDRVREGIIRALAVPAANIYWEQFVEAIKGLRCAVGKDVQIRDALAIAIANSVSEREIPELIDLVRDESFGESRLLLLQGLRSSNQDAALAMIKELGTDPFFSPEIESWRRGRD